MIARKVSAGRRSPPVIPTSCSVKPNREATEAATIPRGPIQAMKIFSRQLKSVRQVAASTEAGRTTSIMNTIAKTPLSPSAQTTCRFKLAASRINNTLMLNVVKVSLK